jgi:hypothetical protein
VCRQVLPATPRAERTGVHVMIENDDPGYEDDFDYPLDGYLGDPDDWSHWDNTESEGPTPF